MNAHAISSAPARTLRVPAIATALGAVLWTALLLVPGTGTATPPWAIVGLAAASVLLAAAPWTVFTTGVAGRGLLARAGVAISLLARAVFVVGMAGILIDPTTEATQSATPIAALLTTVGMLLLGVATLRARVWRGWRAWTVLGVGAFFLLQVPVQFVAFIGPTGNPSYAVLAAWGVFWLALAVALAQEGERSPGAGLER